MSIPAQPIRPLSHISVAAVFALLAMRTVLLFAGNAIIWPASGTGPTQIPIWVNVTVVIVDLITIAILARLLRRDGRTLRVFFAPRLRDTGWGLLAFLIILVAFIAAVFIGNLVAYAGPPPTASAVAVPLWLGLWSLIVLPVTTAVAEEGLYRGYATEQLTPRLGRVGTLLVVALFFAVQHAALTPLVFQAQVARFVTTLLVGIAFGLLRLWFQRLWPLVMAHWLVNVLGLGLPMLFAALATS